MPCFGETNLKKDNSPKTVTIFIGLFFLVNFVLGAGFLGIPFTFFHGGVLAGVLTLILISFLALKTALYTIETMSRAQALSDLKDGLYDTTDSTGKPDFKIKDTRKFEVTELCEIFVGKWFKVVYVILMLAHGLLTLLTYATVASSAWAVNIPLNFGTLRECSDLDFLNQYFPADLACGNAYRLCLAFFAAIVIPLSLLDLKEQAIFQFLLGILRFVMLLSIITYCVYHIISGDHITFEEAPSVSDINLTDLFERANSSMTTVVDIIFHFDFNGWIIGIPIILYAIMLHQGIPSLVHPIKEKKWLKYCFQSLFFVVGSFYLIVSVLGAVWFRDIVNETFTLNWVPYTRNDYSIPIRVFSYFIIIFPSIDVCSVYPLVVHALTNNIFVVLFCRDTSESKGFRSILLLVVLKFIVAFLPIVIGLFVSNLVYIIKFAGLVGYFIGLFAPIILQYRSMWVCKEKFSFLSNSEQMELKKLDKSSLSDNDAAEKEEDNHMTTNGDVLENDPLINQAASPAENNKSNLFLKKLKKFFFSCKDLYLHYTPYSTIFSHPLSVAVFAVLSVILFFLGVTSLFVHPTSM